VPAATDPDPSEPAPGRPEPAGVVEPLVLSDTMPLPLPLERAVLAPPLAAPLLALEDGERPTPLSQPDTKTRTKPARAILPRRFSGPSGRKRVILASLLSCAAKDVNCAAGGPRDGRWTLGLCPITPRDCGPCRWPLTRDLAAASHCSTSSPRRTRAVPDDIVTHWPNHCRPDGKKSEQIGTRPVTLFNASDLSDRGA
jgi:hypothetical protein